MMGSNQQYKWNIAHLPQINNLVNRRIIRMNKYGRLPFPYSFFATILNQKIKEKHIKIKHVNFNHDFFCLFGNIYGESVWFTNTYILDYAPVYFGKHITIGPDVKLITSWHETENFNIVRAAPITIGDNVWITMNVVVLPGVTIGKNSIIAAGSIVTKDVPENTLVGGNPARVIRKVDRSYPYWEDLSKDILQNKEKENRIILRRIFSMPIKLIKKVSIILIKKLL